MKKLLLLIVMIATLCGLASAQTTNVTLKVIDTSGTPWNGALFSIILTPASGTNGPPFYLQNVQMTAAQTTLTGVLGYNGAATISVSSSNFITPVGSTWFFNVCLSGVCTNTYATVSNSTQTVTLTPSPLPTVETIGTKLRRLAFDAKYNNPFFNPPMQAVAAWVATTAYTVGNVVSNGGNDYVCYTAGTSAGSGGPSGTGAAGITDNTVTWYYYRTTATTSTLATAPVLSTSTTQPGGLTVSYVPVTNDANFLYLGGTPQTSGNAGYCLAGSIVVSGGNCGSPSAIYNQYNAGVQFYTDAPVLAVAMNFGSGKIRFTVDNQLVSLSAQPQGGSNPFYYVLTFTTTGGRKNRKITAEWSDGMGFRGVYVDSASQVWAPGNQDYVQAVLVGDSYSSGGNSFPVLPWNYWPGQVGKALGWADVRINASGNVGYIQTNNGQAFAFVGSLAYTAASNPNLIIVMGGNDDLSFTPAQITTAALSYFKALRAALPGVPIIVTGIYNYGGPTGTTINGENAVLSAFSQWADTNSYWIPIATDPIQPWSTGTGTVVSPTGTGNGDVYISGDNVHPTQQGIDYLALKMTNAIGRIIQRIP